MIFERNFLISILILTNDGSVSIEDAKRDSRIPLATALQLLGKMQNEELIHLKKDRIELDSCARLKVAVRAISLGADVEHVSDLLCWQEFEEIAAFALKSNGYMVQNNVRFKRAGKRWEIDVVGCKKPLVLCVDCKHWQHAITPSTIRKMVNEQTERTTALAASLPNLKLKLECTKWEKAKFIPSVLSLIPSAFKFYNKVPVVPVLQLPDCVTKLPAHVEPLKHIPKTFSALS